MPELPEVQTIVNQLRPRLRGAKIRSWRVFDKAKLRLPQKAPQLIVSDVVRYAKYIVLILRDNNGQNYYLGIHLRMTGQLVFGVRKLSSHGQRMPRAEIETTKGLLQFFDTRRFGTLRFSNKNCFIGSGLEPLDQSFTVKSLAPLLNTTQQLKPLLLDQKKIVGIGNIYVAEILYRAKLSPLRPACSLNKKQIAVLRSAIVQVLKSAIRHKGTTISDYRDAHQATGRYQNKLQVYGREDAPCPRCQRPIKRLTQSNRSTYYCPHCQR